MMQGVGLVSPGIASPFRHPNQYYQKVRRIAGGNLLTQWPEWEITGAVAHDISGNSPAGERDGVYTGVTLGQPGIGDGNLAPQYDGLADFTNVFTNSFRDAFDGTEGTAVIWVRASDVGVWTDGSARIFFRYQADASNFVVIFKNSTNNQIVWQYTAGGTAESVTKSAVSTTDWINVGATWSLSAGASGEMKAYFDGEQEGATRTTLGTFAGILTLAVIGAQSLVPTLVWDGFLAHAFVMDRPATSNEMRSFASLNDD